MAVLAAGCATNPATGERQLSLIPEAQEVQMGRQAAAEVRETLGFVRDDQLQAYVQEVGRRIAAASERPELPWSFRVVDDPTPNAFALPGGFIYITRGMLNLLTSEAELASVLAHEVAHVTARHSVNQVTQQQLAQLGFGIGGALFPAVQSLAPVIGAGLELLFLKHGRDDEREADEIGFRYVREQGYATAEFDDVFAALSRMAPREAGAVPGWLATHPAPAERIETARARAAQTGAAGGRVARERYLRVLDGLVYGDDPRNGFFRENVFYHPGLRFRALVKRVVT
jgi:predicted Zn-dependent protease